MKTVFLFFILLIGFIIAGKLVATDAGYVLIQIQGIAIETSVFVLAAGIVVLAAIVFLLSKLVKSILNSTSMLKHYRTNRNQRRAQASLEKGLQYILEENWGKAENELKYAAKHPAYAVSASLGMAKVSAHNANWQQSVSYLSQAQSQLDAPSGVGLQLAEVDQYISGSQWDKALNALEKLQEKYKKHPGIIKRLVEVYKATADWSALLETLPLAAKAQAYTHEMMGSLCESALANHLDQLLKKDEANITQGQEQRTTHHQQAVASLLNLPAAKYLLEENFLGIAQELLTAGEPDAARVVLEHGIKRHANSEKMVVLYADIACDNTELQHKFIQHHVKALNKSWAYFYALAQTNLKMGDSQTAFALLEKSIKAKPSVKAYTALAQIYSQQQNFQQSDLFYRKALSTK